MWLEVKQTVTIAVLDIAQLVVPVVVDVFALSEEPALPGEDSFRVGRLLADRLDVTRIEELGDSVWDVADSDSSGLEAAWASLLDEHGDVREEDFEAAIDQVVYLYRFALHADFAESKLAIMDMFCHLFGQNAIVLAQHHTTLFSDTEFNEIGFRLLPPICCQPPLALPDFDRDIRFWARENCLGHNYAFSDYPDDAPPALAKHQAWVDEECPNKPLC